MRLIETYKSPLRYPGGKQRDLAFLSPFIPACKEYREPFLGGGSVLLYAIKNSLAENYWANDFNQSLMDFWQRVKIDANALAELARSIRDDYQGPIKNCPEWQKFRKKFLLKLNQLPDDQIHKAVRFFILNRSTSGGSTESGGMTPGAYCDRFTSSSIETLKKLTGILSKADVKLTNNDYEDLLKTSGKNVFIFLDPPYLSASQSGLYGKSGNLHKGFDHQRLAKELWQCEHRWLMTIDNCQEIRNLYYWANTLPWYKAYGMTNFGGQKSKVGKELLLSNYSLEPNQFTNYLESLSIEYIEVQALKIHPVYAQIYDDNIENNTDDLLKSIKTFGFYKYQPIIVNDKLEILSGNKRFNVAISAGIDQVPIRKTNFNEVDLYIYILSENKYKEKTNYQRAKEYELWKWIESNKKSSQYSINLESSNHYIQVSLNLEDNEKRNIAGPKVGWSGRTADKALMAAKIIQFLESTNDPKDQSLAKEGLNELKRNPSSGYNFAREVIKSRPELEKQLKQDRFILRRLDESS